MWTKTQAEQIQILRDAIKASGLSARRFAREILWRDERTIRRWLAGDSPIPAIVLERLAAQTSRADAETAAQEWEAQA